MDQNLVRWGRAVKSRTRHAHRDGQTVPVLWLFTDAARVPDPLTAAQALARLRPRGLAGIVFRPEGYAAPGALARELARCCRAAGLVLTVAGDVCLPGHGRHLRGGRIRRRNDSGGRAAIVTASAHGVADLRRGHRAGADIVFLSPVFATASHPGAAGLGVLRWTVWRKSAFKMRIFALGGIDGMRIRRLPRAEGAGAVTGLCVLKATQHTKDRF